MNSLNVGSSGELSPITTSLRLPYANFCQLPKLRAPAAEIMKGHVARQTRPDSPGKNTRSTFILFSWSNDCDSHKYVV